MPVKEVGVELGWGPIKLKGTWEPNIAERDAAWELYVELVTRISVAPLETGQGVLREALTSIYQLFGATRDILRRYGPKVARPTGRSDQYRFGYLSIWMLNAAIRPVLSQWHPELQRWEAGKPEGLSVAGHEDGWEKAEALRRDLEGLRQVLLQYARLFAEVCEAPALIIATDEILARHASEQHMSQPTSNVLA